MGLDEKIMIAKYYEHLGLHRTLVFKVGMIYGFSPEQLVGHDLSKYSDNEFLPYANWFYGNRKAPGAYLSFMYAWKHHINHNAHHWQHWLLQPIKFQSKDDISPSGAIPMEHSAIQEMIVDWQAMEIQLQHRVDMSEWLEKQFNNNVFIFHSDTWYSVLEQLHNVGYEHTVSSVGHHHFYFDRENKFIDKLINLNNTVNETERGVL